MKWLELKPKTFLEKKRLIKHHNENKEQSSGSVIQDGQLEMQRHHQTEKTEKGYIVE
jgi:hypothetical protein